MSNANSDLMRIVREALAQPDPLSQSAYLDLACGGDAAVRAQVTELLAANPNTGLPVTPDASDIGEHSLQATVDLTKGSATGDPIPDDDTPVSVAISEATGLRRHGATTEIQAEKGVAFRSPDSELGTVIADRYTLDALVGEGGMGTVYRATQSEPVKRQVALKLIKRGMDSKSVLARFDAERQALALMDHPNIARVYDGGTTVTGQPFFVMELVHGISLTEYCDQHRLSVDARLQLFVSVCLAVQHAHQKGIIHRDLKPSNVLVTEVDGRPTPKVIDFGVAKAIKQDLTDLSFTDVGAIVGTPVYMSPEQADPLSMDIDTRTDVYALGVMLYELMAGSTPIEAKRFARGAVLEMLRMVREEEPPRPSTRLSTADALPNIAANRSIEPSKLANLLRGELDWVVMKALEKDRNRRYETANGLARDIQRYLADEMVEARPPSAGYRLRKLIRRNRSLVTAGAAVALALLIGIVGFAWQASIARGQRDRAVYAEGQAKQRADELQKVSDYQAKMLQQIDAADAGIKLMADLRSRHDAALTKGKISDTDKAARTAAFERELGVINPTDAAVALLDRTVLAPAIRTIDAQFADQPLVDASLRTTMAVIYHSLGRPAEALALYQRAYQLRAKTLGEEHPDTLASRFGVGRTQGELQRLPEAEATVRATLGGYQRALGEDHKETLETKSLLATQMNYQGKYAECETLTRDVLERRRRVLGADHPDTLETMSHLGMYLTSRGQYAEAVAVLREVVAAQRRVADAAVAGTLANLGVALIRQREFVAAEPILRESLERNRQDLGESHPYTVRDVSNLATLLMDLGKLSEADALAKEALEKCRRIHGNEHANTLRALNIMGQVLYRENKFLEVEPYYREALTTGRRVLGEEHPDTIIWIDNLGTILQRLGRNAEAESLFREALDKNSRQLGETHPYTLTMLKTLVGLLRQQKKLGDAESYLRRALEKVRQVHGADHQLTLDLIGPFGGVLRDQGKLAEAETYFQQSIDTNRRLHGDDHADTLLAILRMGSLRLAQGKNAETLALLGPLENKLPKAFPGPVGLLRQASLQGIFGKARTALAKTSADYTVAESNLLEAQAVFSKMRGQNDIETREWTKALVDLYTNWNKAEPGKGYDAKAATWQAKLGDQGLPAKN